MKAGDRVLLPGWGGSPIKVGEEVRASLVSCRSTFLADVSYACAGVLPLPRLGDSGEDPGVSGRRGGLVQVALGV